MNSAFAVFTPRPWPRACPTPRLKAHAAQTRQPNSGHWADSGIAGDRQPSGGNNLAHAFLFLCKRISAGWAGWPTKWGNWLFDDTSNAALLAACSRLVRQAKDDIIRDSIHTSGRLGRCPPNCFSAPFVRWSALRQTFCGSTAPHGRSCLQILRSVSFPFARSTILTLPLSTPALAGHRLG